METFYLICFGIGLVLSVAFFFGGFAHLHLGHLHIGHSGLTHHGAPAHGSGSRGLSAVNGFTLTAFLCWFGGAGYLLHRYSIFVAPLVLLLSITSGVFGAALLWAVLFKVLIPHERVLSSEDTEMTGVLAKVSDSIRGNGSIGEILFSQTGARRSSAARSDDGFKAASLAEALSRHSPIAASTSHALQSISDKGTICRTRSSSLLVW